MKKKIWVWGGVCLFFLVVGLPWRLFGESYWGLKIDQKECKNAIKSTLKAPASAQFSNFEKIENGDFWYDVDAQNSYGALIRSSYVCEKVWEKIFAKQIENWSKDWYRSFVKKKNEAKDFMEKQIESCIKIKKNKEEIENSPFADAFSLPDTDDICGDILPYV